MRGSFAFDLILAATFSGGERTGGILDGVLGVEHALLQSIYYFPRLQTLGVFGEDPVYAYSAVFITQLL